ncbi:hypothetical protein AB0395_22160 [Streptosporangium sp. NPDC051023]|uniref:hypothetical protein n=1 Tax=Streptosporangium sp. NPDC051023 TaxID=3155410 RepID=UPI00344D0E6D
MNAAMPLEEILTIAARLFTDGPVLPSQIAAMQHALNGPDPIAPVSLEILATQISHEYNKSTWGREGYNNRIVDILGRRHAEEMVGDPEAARLSGTALGARVHLRLQQALAVLQIQADNPMHALTQK